MSAAYEAHVEHETIGGRRVFVVLSCGPKWVRAFVPSIMATITIDRDDWDGAAPIPLDSSRVARIIRRTRRLWARLYPASEAETAQRWRSASAAALEILEQDQGAIPML